MKKNHGGKHVISILIGMMLLTGVSSPVSFASESLSRDKAAIPSHTLNWGRRIDEDITEGDYFTKNLGMERVTRQSVIRTLEENWTSGLKYGEARYWLAHENPPACVNYGSRQYEGRERDGYGFNCTGFIASVLYYANGESREDALTKMKEYYAPLQRRTGSFTDGTGWYSYLADGQKAEEGASVPKTRVYYMGEAVDPDSLQEVLTEAEKAGKVKPGYILFFWPSGGWDCHFGIYAGRDGSGVHQMYHAAGRGDHNGVRLTEPIALSRAASEGASYLYIIPLPEAMTGWNEVEGRRCHYYENGELTVGWYKEKDNWFYLSPVNGKMTTGLQTIGGKTYYFTGEGYLVRNCLFGMYFHDQNGVRVQLWKRLGEKP